MELIVSAALIALALLCAPVLVTVLVLRYISSMEPGPLQQQLAGLARLTADALYRQNPPAGTQEPLPIVSPEIVEFALQESEPWAREDLIARARQLYSDYDDGRSTPELVWGRVLTRLEQDAGLTSRTDGD